MVGNILWAALLLSGVALEILARRATKPTVAVSGLVYRMLSHRLGRVVLFVGWVFLGWHLFARYGVAPR